MDCLVLENHLLIKDEQHPGLREDTDLYKAKYTLD
jgi:hypothetical protein